MRSTRGNARKGFVDRGSNAAINIGRCAVLETRPEKLKRSKFVGQPLNLDVYKDKLKPKAGVRSRKAGSRLRSGVYYPKWSWNIFCFADDIHEKMVSEVSVCSVCVEQCLRLEL